jgi:hypothetical protein
VAEPEAFYLPSGDGFVATKATQGGWDPNAQHGGPVEGLVARAVERTPTLVPMQVVRITFDLIRPVPIGSRLDVTTRIVREGKKIQVVEAVMTEDGTELVRAVALRLRTADLTDVRGLPSSTMVADTTDLPMPDSVQPMVPWEVVARPGFLDGIELRRFPRPGAPEGVTAYWVRVRLPLVLGEETSDLARLAIAADFTNNIGVLIETHTFTAINPDVNVHVVRPPAGEWIAVVGETRFDMGAGLGVSTAELRDLDGVCAIGTTSTLVQPR